MQQASPRQQQQPAYHTAQQQQAAAALPAMLQPRPQRRCAEVCLELLLAEAVQQFSEQRYGPAGSAALQAVGFRVGRQLAERCVGLQRWLVRCRPTCRGAAACNTTTTSFTHQLRRSNGSCLCIHHSAQHSSHATPMHHTCRARSYSRDKPRLGDTLDVIKFVCKDFWLAVFKKQVDNLKTNHRVRAVQKLWLFESTCSSSDSMLKQQQLRAAAASWRRSAACATGVRSARSRNCPCACAGHLRPAGQQLPLAAAPGAAELSGSRL